MSQQLTVVIEKTEHNFSAYIKEISGIAVTGNSINEIKDKMGSVIEDYIQTCLELHVQLPDELQGDFSLTFVEV